VIENKPKKDFMLANSASRQHLFHRVAGDIGEAEIVARFAWA